jgi:GNAT superfamily N-acetyltransferase
MPMVSVQPLTSRQIEAAQALFQIVCPTRADLASTLAIEEANQAPSARPDRLVAIHAASQQVVGFAAYWRVRHAKYRLDLLVHPDRRGQGIGSRLLNHVLIDLNAIGATTVQARADAAASTSLSFLAHRGFVETQRMVELRLSLAAVDLSHHDLLVTKLAAQGITLSSLAAETAADPACWRKLVDLHNAALPDWPDPDPGPVEPLTPKAFQRLLAGYRVMAEAFSIAKHGEQYVGYSGLADPHRGRAVVESAGTAVRPEYSGRHIATVLKQACLAVARQRGYVTAVTRSANPAMVRVNEKVGFQRGAVEVRLVKPLP